MALSDVTNTLLDAALAAYAAPYGPLTRTGTLTDLDTLPTLSPNSDVQYHVKSTINSAPDIFISYDQLANAAVAASIVEDAFGLNRNMKLLADWVVQLDAIINHANFDPLTAPTHYWQILLKAFQAMPKLGITIPFETYNESAPHLETFNAAFTLADVSDVITLTNTSTGKYQYALVYWGDGHMEIINDPDNQPTVVHDYAHAAAATYTVRLWLIGYEGRVDVATGSAVIS